MLMCLGWLIMNHSCSLELRSCWVIHVIIPPTPRLKESVTTIWRCVWKMRCWKLETVCPSAQMTPLMHSTSLGNWCFTVARKTSNTLLPKLHCSPERQYLGWDINPQGWRFILRFHWIMKLWSRTRIILDIIFRYWFVTLAWCVQNSECFCWVRDDVLINNKKTQMSWFLLINHGREQAKKKKFGFRSSLYVVRLKLM